MITLKTHFGVYGVCLKNNELLCVKKNSGPYKKRFDLPGGSPEVAEGLTDTLVREFLEETGLSILRYSNNRVYDVFVHESGKEYMVHHIFAVYDVDLQTKKQAEIPREVVDGENDSNGSVWIEIDQLNSENASPLVLKLLEEIRQQDTVLEKSLFVDWQVLT